jgi:peptidoglycan/xylan/chitin deacetylase (PgdA/CDA1 family)
MMRGWKARGSIAERTVFGLAYHTGFSRLAARLSKSLGAICMFHSVVPHRASCISPDLRTTPAFLDKLLSNFGRAGIDVISIDDLPSRLAAQIRRRFIIMTFDDGYADNLIHALPVFEKHAAPMTVYVTSGLVTRSVDCWWLGLERLFLDHDEVEVEAMGRRWHVATLAEKQRAYEACCAWVVADISARALMIGCTFARYGIPLADLADNAFLNVAQLRQLGTHPLVTIGGHTQSHPELAKIPEVAAAKEIVEDKRFLEGILERPVLHLAYPFGWPTSCGPREARLARAAGYTTAVTTRHDCVGRANLGNLHLLPRVGSQRHYESLSLLRVQVDGLLAAVKGLLPPGRPSEPVLDRRPLHHVPGDEDADMAREQPNVRCSDLQLLPGHSRHGEEQDHAAAEANSPAATAVSQPLLAGSA